MTYKIPRAARRREATEETIAVAPIQVGPSPVPAHEARESFMSLSAALTGFAELELAATGVAELYLRYLEDTFPDVLGRLLAAWRPIERDQPETEREAALRVVVMPDPELGPFARALLGMWYTATWAKMPTDWSQAYGDHGDVTAVVAGAYPEGLAWRAGGLHPQGAKPTGFGSWAFPPSGSTDG